MKESDEQLDEILYNLAFGDDLIAREKEIFSRLGKQYSSGELVVKEGDVSDQLFLVVSGSLKIVKDIGTEDEKAIALLTDGEMFGEMSYFDNLPRSASVVAATDSEVLVLDREQFDMIFQLHPKWTTKIIQSLSNRIYLAYLDLRNSAEILY
ncbi:MAG: hypothetical protein DKM50_12980 [Candidatus Margulisiibacteriota bacterium]|nr:MAG: hypothetical protein A2X43_11220 [Candidatus Margulisbacteria bacterium GWD2_39_127]OGI02796.1 MAG: hypothetical protein A2X42_02045 [Candidatus Margulisbacteria bacterium GWF2_38_17]OGI09317.1 MAG: hypothetical protein A2X41_09330 [Candidatus Margulisbacteria bacterium GWE2_39_32]PZM77387.1 MAG: hypothetical protein DKM50_12980 [Candidatus Margulisiibacteriota bacterium]HAR63966.1 hypothetical protein [Candidatus Margulisiibacteriota bacterium]